MNDMGPAGADDSGFSRRTLPRRRGRGRRRRRAGRGDGRPRRTSQALAATAPAGPPTTTLPLPTTTAPEQLLLTWGADPATAVTVSWSAPGTVAQPAPMLCLLRAPDHRGTTPATRQAARAGAARRDPSATPKASVGQLHRRAQRPDDVLLPRAAHRPGARHQVLLPGQRRRGAARPRPAPRFQTAPSGPRQVPLLQLRRPGHPVLGPERLRQHLARVLRQRLLRGQRDREPRRRPRRAAVPPAQRRPVLRQPGHHERPRRLARLRRQHVPLGREPPVDARARQPRDRVRHLRPRGPAGHRAGRHRGPGRGRQLLERPVRLRPLPEPLPAARQRRHQLGRQPPARQLLQLPGRHGAVHLPGRRRRHLPGRRLGLPERRPERRAGDHLVGRADPQRHGHLQPRLHRRPRRSSRQDNSAVPGPPQRPARTCRPCGSSARSREARADRSST